MTVKLALKEWQFSDGLNSLDNPANVSSRQALYGPSFQSTTGRKLKITVVEGRNLMFRSGKIEPYVKLQYGKVGAFPLNFNFLVRGVHGLGWHDFRNIGLAAHLVNWVGLGWAGPGRVEPGFVTFVWLKCTKL